MPPTSSPRAPIRWRWTGSRCTAQATYTNQYDPPFRAPYSGTNSLAPGIGRETFDYTIFAGMRLWQGAEAWINPEIDQGFGLSGSVGAAGFPSGEAYKVGADYPYVRLQRAFIRQTIDLGGEEQKLDAGANQFSGSQTADRIVITVGKFGVCRRVRHQQICPRPARRLPELDRPRYRQLRLRGLCIMRFT